jgi:hypothetical protein
MAVAGWRVSTASVRADAKGRELFRQYRRRGHGPWVARLGAFDRRAGPWVERRSTALSVSHLEVSTYEQNGADQAPSAGFRTAPFR